VIWENALDRFIEPRIDIIICELKNMPFEIIDTQEGQDV
jgi:hypothetical protein